MRLLRLGLHAFGPFTETVLELSGPQSGGLHVIYGRNEAGKSTALRAVSGLLFGIGERTPDAHLHQGRELKLSAVVEDGARRLDFVRRKRRKDSLRTPDDEPLAEAELAAFLHGVDATLFHTLFGLDHERLKQGGQALLSGQGDIGESLFDAGTGGAGIHAVLADLERECETLFKARASKPTLNAAVQEYRQAKKQTRDEVRLPEKYLEQLRQLEQAREQRQLLTRQRAELSQRRERLDRVLATLPIVARRQQCLLELEALVDVPELPEGTPLRRQEAQLALSECARGIERIERELARRQTELASLPTDAALVELSKHVIDEIRDKVGIHKKAARDLPNVRGQIKQAEAEAQRILSKIGHGVDLEQAQNLRLNTARIATIRRLARERGVLVQKRETLSERLEQLQQELEQQRRELSACGPSVELGPLEQALGEAKAAGDLEVRVAQQRELLAEATQRSTELERRLFNAPLGERPLPGAVIEQEAIEAFATRFARAERALEQASADELMAERELAEAERHIDAIERQGVVPTEAELMAARGERDAKLSSLLEDRDEGERLEAYVALVARSDDIADRLRREAQRVAELSQWQASRKHWQLRLDAASRSRNAAESTLLQLTSEWRALWADFPLRLGSPSEMLAWHRRYQEWQSSQAERARFERQLEELDAACRAHAQALSGALGDLHPPGTPSLAGLIATASEQLALLRQRERERQTLKLTVRQLEASVAREQRALQASEQPLAAWAQAWSAAVEPLGLGTAPGSDEALAVLEEMVELMRKLDELPQNRRRVAGMERDAKAFEALLNPLLAKYASDLIGLSVEEAAERFVSRYQEAMRHAEERDRLKNEITGLEHELSQEQAKRAEADQQLTELLKRARANDSTELEHLESQWRQVQELRERLRELDDQLLDQGGGTPLQVLIQEASATDRAALVVQRDALKAELEDTETAWRDAEVTIDRLERGLHYYSDEAASDSLQHLEQRAAHVRELLERYLRVRLAKTLLEREIARYRERHQGPVLSRASQLFRRLTLERFQGLRLGLEERTLSSLRADGDEVSVSELSEGTQYQLYLALRLATLEHYMKDSAPIPLVLDDLLIHFDDERAAAALSVLGELAQRIQILYFTHLSRDLPLSERSVNPAVLQHHYLTPARERVSVLAP